MEHARSHVLAPRSMVWAARLVWLITGVTGYLALARALDHRATTAAVVVSVAAWGAFGVVLAALVVPSTVSLTITRMAAPLAVVAAIVAAACRAGAGRGIAFIVAALLCVVVFGSGEFGEAFAQASAYGDEQRFPLRPPAAYLLPAALAWAVWATALLVGVLLLAGRRWITGAIVVAAALALTWAVGIRLHRLARRWLVVVPAGLVVHDHLVLADTVLVQKGNVSRLELAYAGTEALDATGPAAGHVVELAVREMITVVFAPTRAAPKGNAVHALSLLLAPTRPGRALRAAAGSDLPVG